MIKYPNNNTPCYKRYKKTYKNSFNSKKSIKIITLYDF